MDISSRYLSVVSVVIIIGIIFVGVFFANYFYKIRLERATDGTDMLVAEVLRSVVLRDSIMRRESNESLSIGRLPQREILKRCQRLVITDPRPAEDLLVLDRLTCDLSEWQRPVLAIYLLETNGYNAGIRFLLGVESRNMISVVKIISHRESTNFGSVVLQPNSDWLTMLVGQSAEFFRRPPDPRELDAFSGATITASALRRAIEKTLNLPVKEPVRDDLK